HTHTHTHTYVHTQACGLILQTSLAKKELKQSGFVIQKLRTYGCSYISVVEAQTDTPQLPLNKLRPQTTNTHTHTHTHKHTRIGQSEQANILAQPHANMYSGKNAHAEGKVVKDRKSTRLNS